jgi:hypothetical protein
MAEPVSAFHLQRSATRLRPVAGVVERARGLFGRTIRHPDFAPSRVGALVEFESAVL